VKQDFAKAESFYQRGWPPLLKRDLAITEKGLGPDHRLAAAPLNNLVGIYQLQGDYTKAEPLISGLWPFKRKG
jgi:hypothetical protein